MIRNFYYGIITDSKNNKMYLGRDDNSGGYPYCSDTPVIFFDTVYLHSHIKDSYLIDVYGKYTLKIYKVNPVNNTITQVDS
jgi:hypothetical protein